MIPRASRLCAVVIVAACCAAGCATITRGTRIDFTVETSPPGASVKGTNGLECASTPCTFPKVDRETNFQVEVSKPGYETATYDITHKAMAGGTAGMIGNVLIGGLVGIIVDANSGATQGLVPNPLRVELKPLPPVAAQPPAEGEIAPVTQPSS